MESRESHQQHAVNLTTSELDKLNLDLPRALALADVMFMAAQGSPKPEPESIEQCASMLWELLDGVNCIWGEVMDRREAKNGGE